MEETRDMFFTAERRFQKLNSHPDVVTDSKVNLAWWESLEQVYERERVVWRHFVGPQPTLEQNKLYARFRAMLLKGQEPQGERLISLRRQPWFQAVFL